MRFRDGGLAASLKAAGDDPAGSSAPSETRGETRAQLSLGETVFGDADLVARLTRFSQAVNFELEVFPPQHVSALQRLLVLHGADRALGEESDVEQAVFNRIFFAMASLSDDSGLGAIEDEGRGSVGSPT